ncbi:unnamed protein product, partial [Hapterophycus canaliculatus]
DRGDDPAESDEKDPDPKEKKTKDSDKNKAKVKAEIKTEASSPSPPAAAAAAAAASDDDDDDTTAATPAEAATRTRGAARAASAAAEYLLYQLCMAAPAEFADCIGPERESRLMLPILAEQFVRQGPPVPSEAGPRGAGLGVAAAAHALAGVGLISGEKRGGRRRAAASAAGHAAVLADVARRMPLVFLEQVPALTEILLNDAEVERSAAAAE